MIKANCENGEIELTLKGDMVELIADVSIILHAVYRELSKENFLLASRWNQSLEMTNF